MVCKKTGRLPSLSLWLSPASAAALSRTTREPGPRRTCRECPATKNRRKVQTNRRRPIPRAARRRELGELYPSHGTANPRTNKPREAYANNEAAVFSRPLYFEASTMFVPRGQSLGWLMRFFAGSNLPPRSNPRRRPPFLNGYRRDGRRRLSKRLRLSISSAIANRLRPSAPLRFPAA